MKLIIAGSRTLYPTGKLIDTILDEIGIFPSEIISGGADGVDSCAKEFCRYEYERFHHYQIPYTEIPADWVKFGKMAGPIRNKQMAEEGDALLLIWDGESPGSANMKKEMLFKKKPVYEVILKVHNV